MGWCSNVNMTTRSSLVLVTTLKVQWSLDVNDTLELIYVLTIIINIDWQLLFARSNNLTINQSASNKLIKQRLRHSQFRGLSSIIILQIKALYISQTTKYWFALNGEKERLILGLQGTMNLLVMSVKINCPCY